MQPHEEPRSFAPRDHDTDAGRDEPAVKTKPVKVKGATLEELARGHNSMHRCLDKAAADILEVKKALGLGEGGQKVVGLATWWQSFRRTVLATTSSIVALAVIYRIGVALWPAIEAALVALNRLALSAHI